MERARKQYWYLLNKLTIRQKLFLGSVIMPLITSGIFALVAYNAVTSEVHQNLDYYLNTASQKMRYLLSFTSQNAEQISTSIIANQDVQDAVRVANQGFSSENQQAEYSNRVENEFFKIILGRDEVHAVFLLLNNGYKYSLVVNPQIESKVINKEYLHDADPMEEGLVWLPKDILSGTIPIARNFIDIISQKISGTVLIFIDERYFAKQLSLQNNYLETYFLVSEKGTVISSSDNGISEKHLKSTTIKDKIHTQKDSLFHIDINGATYKVWSLPIPEYDCILVIFIPMAQILKQTQPLKTRMLLIGFVFCFFSVSIGLLISKSILMPTKLLHQSIDALDKNDSFQKIDWTSEDEIGRVVNTYNNMMIRLEKAKYDLIKSENEYRSIFQNAKEGIFRCDKNGLILKANPALAGILGYGSPQELIADRTSIQELVDDETVKRIPPSEKLNWLRSNPESELSGVTRSGEKIFVKLKIESVVDENSQDIWHDGILEDITRLKLDELEKEKMQTQFQQMQRLESLGTLAGGIAHDFNNILSAIMGYAQLAQLTPEEDDKVQSCINEILVASDRASILVKRILIFSRKESSEKQLIEIGLVIREALKLIKSAIPSTIEFSQNIKPDAGVVYANETQIHQVVINLCTNAYQAMAQTGGTLDVTLENITIIPGDTPIYSQISPGQYLRLIVTDTGHGIPAKLLPHVFEPYFTTKKAGEGTGMGLSIVHGIVRDHGGEIKVYSEPGIGTTFHVLFPLSHEAATQYIGPSEVLPGGNEHILFIDDERQVIESGGNMLKSLGYQVETVSNSIDALEMFKINSQKYDLVFSDITMPKMTGDKLAIEIKKIRPDIPIILNSGFNISIDDDRLSKLEVDDLLIKPISLSKLATTVRKVLDESSTRASFIGRRTD